MTDRRGFCYKALALSLSFFAWTEAPANAGLPAVKALNGTQVSASAAHTYYNAQGGTIHTNKLRALASVMCGLPHATAIEELARALSRSGTLSSDQFAPSDQASRPWRRKWWRS
ncbi:MAG: hypothetical protein WDM81_11650 [Rhizomicrobium sp.]